MSMKRINKHVILLAVVSPIMLTACMSPIEGKHSEQQQRMLRCDQYIGEQRESCLRGDSVTIDDYKDDYKNYKKSKAKEAEQAKQEAQAIKPIIPKPVEK